MIVIKPGSAPDLVYRGKCSHCHCEIECDKAEIKWVYDQRDGDYATYKCPTPRCGKEINMRVHKTRDKPCPDCAGPGYDCFSCGGRGVIWR